MHEWIARVMPLPVPTVSRSQSPYEDVARFRIRVVAPAARPGGLVVGTGVDQVDVGPVRVLALDSANPSGGVGGSLSSEQARWLLGELERARERYVVVATHDSSLTMTSDRRAAGEPGRVMGGELSSILLAHANVIGWVSGTMHHRFGRRHGDPAAPGHGFWELPGASEGWDSPLAGGLAIVRRADHGRLELSGALASGHGPRWELRDPLRQPAAPRTR